MVAKILIKRIFEGGKSSEIMDLLSHLRSKANAQPGYVSGESYHDPQNHQKWLVISTWESLEHWHRWKANPDRLQIEAMLAIYQELPTEYEEYVSG